ncbi:MAG: hypothetical protein K9M57_09635 [Phycisphaerae bacterium]|nr:hypothetical protein [Phycisphaerae bacterium]
MMIKSFDTIRAMGQGGLFVATMVWVLVGCGQSHNATPAKLGEPLWPVTAETVSKSPGADQSQKTRHGGRREVEVVLRYDNRGRDFRAPLGVDGYVLWVTPLGRDYRAKVIDAWMTIRLYNNPKREEAASPGRSLRSWTVPREALAGYWIKTGLLDSYVFRLDWGGETLPPGDYQLTVEMTIYGKDGPTRLVKSIPFQDRIR